uniref:Non-haem dioxygenase N-terminal domain-containing protein n=1 Tax=Kalanchoe fedtschenkoi TaxID=63787 RepID=A0A7N0RIF2_KALFE
MFGALWIGRGPRLTSTSGISEEVTNFVVLQGHRVKGLPFEQRLDMSRVISGKEDSDSSFSLPIIDIVGHGVPLEVLEKVKVTGHKFFEMPTEEKRKYLKVNPVQAESVVHLGTSFSPGVAKVYESGRTLYPFYTSLEMILSLIPGHLFAVISINKTTSSERNLNVKHVDRPMSQLLMDPRWWAPGRHRRAPLPSVRR